MDLFTVLVQVFLVFTLFYFFHNGRRLWSFPPATHDPLDPIHPTHWKERGTFGQVHFTLR